MRLMICCIVGFVGFGCSLNAQYSVQNAFPSLPAFSRPVELVQPNDGTNRFFVVEQDGRIWVFENSPTVSTRKLFLNLSDSVSQGGSETGLLGLAFHPDYANNGLFYVDYTATVGTLKSYITRFQVSPTNPDSAMKNTRQIVLVQNQPYSNHNGGHIAFGPDGYLYIALGDGGSGGDPQGNGQNRATWLGKILRIDVNDTSAGRNYAIPPTNPFYGNDHGYKEEIFTYGMRNPWKFSFDSETGRLWIGDVGQNTYEEIDIGDSGGNYGWNKMEGYHCYGTCDTTGRGFLRPVWEYTHGTNYSVTGGFVYRGTAIPSLIHKYIYGDYGSGRIWSLAFNGTNFTNTQLYDAAFYVSTFGVDSNQNLYVVDYGNGFIYKLTGPSTGLTLLAPNDGEAFWPDSSVQIRWLASGPASVDLAFKASPGQPWVDIATNVDASSGSYSWIVPGVATRKARIRVKESGGALTDSSDGFFTIRLAQILIPRNSVDFDTVYLGQSRSDTLRIWNTGTATLYIDSMVTGTTHFEVNPFDATIGAGTLDTVHVSGTAPVDSQGEFLDTLRIYYQGGQDPILIPLRMIVTENPAGIDDGAHPNIFALMPNFPNPFNPSTTIRYRLPKRLDVRLQIFNALGQIVWAWLPGEQDGGYHEVSWSARSVNGDLVSSGVYLYRLEAGGQTLSRKMLLIK